MSTVGLKTVEVALQLGAAVGKIIIDAILADDLATLQRVTAVFPVGHELRARLALVAAEERATKALGV